ncbi:unnamed protein product [Pocillopora meandrina]|uniref:Uncharacterized protein n=1 Tax=Pocillopora meandrina TaxID=46732 RepID=A0AAU9XU97_9CNID|nr:unnamed protein product [Pocillopora meandrina]
MIKNLRAHCQMVKQVWLADDSAGGGRIAQVFGDEVNKQLKVSAIKEQSLRRKNTKINIDYVDPIQEAIDDLLLPTLFGQSEPLPNEVRLLVTLTTAQGGLGMPDLRAGAP